MFSLNQAVFQFIYAGGQHGAFLNMLGVFFAEYLPYLLILAFLVLAYYQSGWRRRVYLFSEGALAIILSRGIVTETIRFFYHHPRPFDFYDFTPLIPESGWSFPSGHAAWFFALAMVVWYSNRKWGWWFFALAVCNGVARVYVGVHWPFDIAGGAVVGIVSALFIHWLLAESRKGLEGSIQ